MSFSVSRVTENDLPLVRLQDSATGTIISVLPEFGALLHGFEIPMQGASYNIIDNYAGRKDLDQNLDRWYKSCKLSPFVCRIPNGKYEYGGEQLEFGKKFFDGSAIHGLLYNKPFNILNQFSDDQKASVS